MKYPFELLYFSSMPMAIRNIYITSAYANMQMNLVGSVTIGWMHSWMMFRSCEMCASQPRVIRMGDVAVYTHLIGDGLTLSSRDG